MHRELKHGPHNSLYSGSARSKGACPASRPPTHSPSPSVGPGMGGLPFGASAHRRRQADLDLQIYNQGHTVYKKQRRGTDEPDEMRWQFQLCGIRHRPLVTVTKQPLAIESNDPYLFFQYM